MVIEVTSGGSGGGEESGSAQAPQIASRSAQELHEAANRQEDTHIRDPGTGSLQVPVPVWYDQ